MVRGERAGKKRKDKKQKLRGRSPALRQDPRLLSRALKPEREKKKGKKRGEDHPVSDSTEHTHGPEGSRDAVGEQPRWAVRKDFQTAPETG